MTNKFCHYCQIENKIPEQFKFILKKDVDFNYKIIIDIMYLDKNIVFHVVDAAITFQKGQFLNNISAKKTKKAFH